jgi:hypothetical protein
MSMKDLRKFVSIGGAIKRTGVSGTTLRLEADLQRIRSIRDPAGRRLLLARDVDAYAARRRAKLAAVAAAEKSQEEAPATPGL